MSPKGLLILGAGDHEEGEKEKGEGEVSDEQKSAAKDFAAAVKSGDAEAIVLAFRALDMACGEEY